MEKERQVNFYIAICMLVTFLLWTVVIQFVDVQAIGPQESSVGFATINQFVHNLTGVHMSLYTITDWLGLVPLSFVIWFALLGLIQWIKRKHLLKAPTSELPGHKPQNQNQFQHKRPSRLKGKVNEKV